MGLEVTEYCQVCMQLILIIYPDLNDAIHHKSLLIAVQLLQSPEYLNIQIKFPLKLKEKKESI